MEIKKLVKAMGLCAIIGYWNQSTILAHEGHDHAPVPQEAVAPKKVVVTPKPSHGTNHTHTVIPDSLADTWQAILDSQAKLNEAVSANQSSAIHESSAAISELAQALPEKSKDLTEEKKKRLDGSVSNIRKAVAEIDKANESGNQASTQANVKKLDGLLKLISGLYPEGTLPAVKADSKDKSTSPAQPDSDDHHGHSHGDGHHHHHH